jgi:ArsR family transcriptional regulator
MEYALRYWWKIPLTLPFIWLFCQLTKQLSNGANLDNRTRLNYKARAQIIKAMGHPTRLFIIDELSKGERCVCNLRDLIGADISTVSKHLSVLKQAGIVEDEKRGLQVWYSLRVPCILNFFGCVEDVLKVNVRQAQKAAAR